MNTCLRFLLIPMAAVWLGACVKAETTVIGTVRPNLGPNCAVVVQPNTPDFAVADIATSEVRCHATKGRGACIEKLKEEACKVGANVVYGFREGKIPEYSVITATLATKTGEAAPSATSPAPATGPVVASDGCSPPCSPGYQCEASVCQAVCNPSCSPGFVCAPDRTCQAGVPAVEASSKL